MGEVSAKLLGGFPVAILAEQGCEAPHGFRVKWIEGEYAAIPELSVLRLAGGDFRFGNRDPGGGRHRSGRTGCQNFG